MKKIAIALCAVLIAAPAYAQRFRCTIDTGGRLLHQSFYSSADACYAACGAIAIQYRLRGTPIVSWTCVPI